MLLKEKLASAVRCMMSETMSKIFPAFFHNADRSHPNTHTSHIVTHVY